MAEGFYLGGTGAQHALANPAGREAGDAFDVDVEEISVEGTVGEIGAGVVRKTVRDGVKRV